MKRGQVVAAVPPACHASCFRGAPGRAEGGVVGTGVGEGQSSPHNFMRYVCFLLAAVTVVLLVLVKLRVSL